VQSETEIEVNLDTATTEPYDLFRDRSRIASDLAEADFPYNDDGLKSGKTYCYEVEDDDGSFSEESCSTTLGTA
jgi:hypothetical protein